MICDRACSAMADRIGLMVGGTGSGEGKSRGVDILWAVWYFAAQPPARPPILGTALLVGSFKGIEVGPDEPINTYYSSEPTRGRREEQRELEECTAVRKKSGWRTSTSQQRYHRREPPRNCEISENVDGNCCSGSFVSGGTAS
jgi:hypothetical protein